MYIISTEKIDGWGGSVIAGTPVDGDLVRITYDNGAIREKIYWDIFLPEPPLADQEVYLRGQLRRLINGNTPAVIANFTYNGNTYNLTENVIKQVTDFAMMVMNSDTPAAYFPVDIVVGEQDAMEVVVSVNATGFKNAYTAIMEHIRAKRVEARQMKQSLEALDLAQLRAWTDPRI